MPNSFQELLKFLKYERSCNLNRKSRTLISLFRLAQFFSGKSRLNPLRILVLFLYRLASEWITGCEIPPSVKIGIGLKIFHPSSIAINHLTIIGENVTIRQNTTIGHSYIGGSCPEIGDNVNIGANVCIIGDVRIQGQSIIGAGSVVVHDVPFGSTVVGNPAKSIIR
jgi:putative colanic acid biosynthesis acetyltransferase WcaB